MNQQLTIAELGAILSIWAHPDDETYLAGGIMASAVAGGQRVVCVSATAGERGTDDAILWPPERLGRVRRWEAAAAMAVLGVRDHRWLDYPDGELAKLDPAEPIARIAALITEVAPDTILTFGSDGITFHTDHQTVSSWVGAAWEQAGRPGRLLHATVSVEHLDTWRDDYERWQVYMTDERPTGVPADGLAIHHVCEGALLDQKLAALNAMYTQTSTIAVALGVDAYRALNAAEYFVEAQGAPGSVPSLGSGTRATSTGHSA
jgi:LmbE family N-acetylglucosaminyl deacetylase